MNRATKGRGNARSTSRPHQSVKSPGSIRIIGGQWRGRKLPVHDIQGLRPTTDRNKETLFNWLMQSVVGANCLDLFAGSGGLGFEALSRYAKHCVFVEKQAEAALALEKNIALLTASATVLNSDALSTELHAKGPFDLIFVDPPFGLGLVPHVLELIQTQKLLANNGMIYVEQEINAPLPELSANWHWHKQKKTSALIYGLIINEQR